MFFNVSLKYYFICWYFIPETVFYTSDVRMTSLKGTHLILASRTDHMVTRKGNLLSIFNLFLAYPNNEIRTP